MKNSEQKRLVQAILLSCCTPFLVQQAYAKPHAGSAKHRHPIQHHSVTRHKTPTAHKSTSHPDLLAQAILRYSLDNTPEETQSYLEGTWYKLVEETHLDQNDPPKQTAKTTALSANAARKLTIIDAKANGGEPAVSYDETPTFTAASAVISQPNATLTASDSLMNDTPTTTATTITANPSPSLVATVQETTQASEPISSSNPSTLPVINALSPYGNLPTYTVAGKTYHVTQARTPYHSTGLASWYGKDFHEHRTSSGEMYDMYKLTAAHKTLPIPSYVKVTNLKNHKNIIVRVNDRGPFHDGRIIDLSYGAAKELGIDRQGVGEVEIEMLNVFSDAAASSAKYYLQLGAFGSKVNAMNLLERAKKAITQPINLIYQKSAELFYVRVGPLQDYAVTEQLADKLAANGFSKPMTLTE